MPARKLPPNDELIAMYQSGMSSGDMAKELNLPPVTVYSGLIRAGCVMRSSSEAAKRVVESDTYKPIRYWDGKKQSAEHVESRISKIRGEQHYFWKGGVSDPRAYRKVVQKDQCARCSATERLAIHHDNNDHYDNRSENLVILCISCHSSVHKQAYWDAIHAGEEAPRSNAPIGWRRGVVPNGGESHR